MSSGGMPYFSVSSWHGPLGHRQLALARERLRLQLVFVDGAHHQRRAVAPGDGADALEFLLAILQVDRVDDALALAPGERQLHRLGVGGVDHHRRFDLADQLVVERRDVLDLVAIGALQADVDDVRAVLHLPARDLAGLFPLLLGDHVLEQPRADDVGALADDQRAVALLGLHQFDARIVGAMRRAPASRAAACPRPSARWLGCAPGWCRSSRRRCSASRARRIARAARPAIPASPGTCPPRSAGRRSDSRKCGTGDISCERADVVGHQVRTGGAVQADGQQIVIARRRRRARRRAGRRASCRCRSMVTEAITGIGDAEFALAAARRPAGRP